MLFSNMKQCFEVKKLYDGSERKFSCQLLFLKNGFGILKYIMEKDYQLEDIFLTKGTISLGFFWENRNYNIYQWFNGNDLLATYFNISEATTLSEDFFTWKDLILDILITSQGGIHVLDENELNIITNPLVLKKIEITKQEILRNYQNIINEINAIAAQTIELI